mgnify:CR=1 FL=1
MTKMFEKVVENSLQETYHDNLFIGKEPDRINGLEPFKSHLNKINYLLENQNDKTPLVEQFPDFLIRDESDIYHIVDAKYKLKDYLLKDRAMFWQVLVYSKLFNQRVENHDLIKKIIILAEYSDIKLDNADKITINSTEAIQIEKCDWYYDEMVFGSKIGFIGMKTLSQLL